MRPPDIECDQQKMCHEKNVKRARQKAKMLNLYGVEKTQNFVWENKRIRSLGQWVFGGFFV